MFYLPTNALAADYCEIKDISFCEGVSSLLVFIKRNLFILSNCPIFGFLFMWTDVFLFWTGHRNYVLPSLNKILTSVVAGKMHYWVLLLRFVKVRQNELKGRSVSYVEDCITEECQPLTGDSSWIETDTGGHRRSSRPTRWELSMRLIIFDTAWARGPSHQRKKDDRILGSQAYHLQRGWEPDSWERMLCAEALQ